ncbi:MAG: 3-ketoacyl-ACP reductase, partial [Spirochaetaceae bacterium]|nr:3-ketoacyl-ACP reductase [Spirochaetaceae bacterium]
MPDRVPVALVTGAGRGLGRGVAAELAKAGFSLAIGYAGNRAAAEECRKICSGSAASPEQRFEIFAADIGSRQERGRLVEEVFAAFGDVDALVNNAGMAPRVRADILEAGEESFEELMRVNLQGPYFLTQAIAKRWVSENKPCAISTGRKIVFVTSISAATASTGRGEYCVSKAGLSMAAMLWAARLAESGIAVYELRPGIMATDMTSAVKEKYDALIAQGGIPQNRWGSPEDVGKAARALLAGDFAYSTGSVITVDGGIHI